MELRDLCGGPPAVILEKTATVMDAISAMVENNTTYVVVNREDTEDAFGLLTITDIINNIIAKDREHSQVQIDEIVSKPLIASNNLDLDKRWVAKKMANEGVSQLAVFDGEDLKCLVSDIDILKAIAKELQEKAKPKEGKK